MLKNCLNSHFTKALFALTLIMLLASCTTSSLIKQDENITIERVDSRAAAINHAYITRTKDGLSLHGELKRDLAGRGPIPGHLHITLVNPQGKVIKETDIGYMRRNVKSAIATFHAKLPIDLLPGSTVRITHFDTEDHEMLPDETIWRDAEH